MNPVRAPPPTVTSNTRKPSQGSDKAAPPSVSLAAYRIASVPSKPTPWAAGIGLPAKRSTATKRGPTARMANTNPASHQRSAYAFRIEKAGSPKNSTPMIATNVRARQRRSGLVIDPAKTRSTSEVQRDSATLP